MITQGIVFYIAGEGINYLVPTAIYSLRKHYQGNIHVVLANNANNNLANELNKINITTSMDKEKHCLDYSKISMWRRKSYHHLDEYPYDINFYYDFDHVWVKDLPLKVFDDCLEMSCVSTGIEPPRAARKLKDLIPFCKEKQIDKLIAISGGCVCVKKNSNLAKEWYSLTNELANSTTRFSRNPEEWALSILFNTSQASSIPLKYSYVINNKYNNEKIPEDTIAIHCTRGSCYLLPQWIQTMRECIDKDFLKIETNKDWYNIPSHIMEKLK